jgi:PDZ domain-containing protein
VTNSNAKLGSRRVYDGRIFNVDIDTGQVGGPSAGLAFALAVIDELTPGELTGGEVVAVTGTIEVDGTVGMVGGVEQKAVAAREQGAVLLPAPEGEGEEARRNAGDMEVREVAHIEDALRALAGVGGNGRSLPGLRRS